MSFSNSQPENQQAQAQDFDVLLSDEDYSKLNKQLKETKLENTSLKRQLSQLRQENDKFKEEIIQKNSHLTILMIDVMKMAAKILENDDQAEKYSTIQLQKQSEHLKIYEKLQIKHKQVTLQKQNVQKQLFQTKNQQQKIRQTYLFDLTAKHKAQIQQIQRINCLRYESQLQKRRQQQLKMCFLEQKALKDALIIALITKQMENKQAYLSVVNQKLTKQESLNILCQNNIKELHQNIRQSGMLANRMRKQNEQLCQQLSKIVIKVKSLWEYLSDKAQIQDKNINQVEKCIVQKIKSSDQPNSADSMCDLKQQKSQNSTVSGFSDIIIIDQCLKQMETLFINSFISKSQITQKNKSLLDAMNSEMNISKVIQTKFTALKTTIGDKNQLCEELQKMIGTYRKVLDEEYAKQLGKLLEE